MVIFRKEVEFNMDEYKRPYLALFNRLTDILEALEEKDYGKAEFMVRLAQQEAEERFISQDGQ